MQLGPGGLQRAAIPIAALLAFGLAAQAALGAESAVTAFTAKSQSVAAGETITFEVGLTSPDGSTWDAASVAVTVEIVDSSGAVVQTSDPVVPIEDIAPGRTTAVFVKVPLAATIGGGTFQARASVKHAGATAAVSDAIPLVVGALAAKSAAPGPAGQPFKINATLSGNDGLATTSSQAGDVALQGKYGADSFDLKAGVAAPQGGAQPLVNFQTPGTTTQFGTYSLALDDGVLSGPSGTGITVKRQWGTLHSIQIGFLSGGHGTDNPFDLYGLAYNMPIRAGTLSLTTGYVNQSGPVTTGANDFLRRGLLYGIIYKHPANDAGFSYQARFGLINYFDALNGVWRADRAFDVQTGFRLLRWDWIFDYNRAGPYYPTLTASSASPDREEESLTGSRAFGPLKVSLKLDDSRTALNGSPSVQTGHVLNETLGLGYTFHSHDTLQLDLSNAVNHVLSDTPTNGLNQNFALAYSGTRGKTGFQLSIGSATTQDNSGTTAHTISDSIQITRPIFHNVNLSTTYSITNSLGNLSSATSIGQQFGVKADYTVGVYSISSGYDWSLTRPFAGVSTPSTTGLNLGLGFKPKFSPTTVQATVTRSISGTSSTVGRLNFSRQY
jgi:hypothetical protein